METDPCIHGCTWRDPVTGVKRSEDLDARQIWRFMETDGVDKYPPKAVAHFRFMGSGDWSEDDVPPPAHLHASDDEF